MNWREAWCVLVGHRPIPNVSRDISIATPGFQPKMVIFMGGLNALAVEAHYARCTRCGVIPGAVTVVCPQEGIGVADA